jgi:hypothetical protein
VHDTSLVTCAVKLTLITTARRRTRNRENSLIKALKNRIFLSLKRMCNNIKVKFTLEQAMKAQRGSIGIAVLWVINATTRPLLLRERDPVFTVQEAGWSPGPVWTGALNLAPTESRSPDRPARRESLYRLPYPGPLQEY